MKRDPGLCQILKDIEPDSIDHTEIIDTTPPEFIAAMLKITGILDMEY